MTPAQAPISRSLQDERKEARDQLTLILSFFPRVDAKASALLAINTAMLGILASKAPSLAGMSTYTYGLAGITLALIAVSLWSLYRVAFPTLDGGQQSLIYFREIGKRTETAFIDTFSLQDEGVRAKDLLGQVWRNSCVLTAKLDALKRAFIFMALAIIPWALAVALFSSSLAGVPALVTR